jgi:Uma2 family endonuclease
LAETQFHLDQIVYLLVALQQWFASRPDVFVAADLLVYYVQGDNRRRFAPDVFVARGVADAKRQRRTYLIWEEGTPPGVAIEVTSRKTRREDTTRKRALYEALGVREYFLFDPQGDYLRPPLQGYRLAAGRYEPVEAPPGAADLRLHSLVLGLDLVVRTDNVPPRARDSRAGRRRRSDPPWDGTVRLYDPVGQRWLLGPDEERAAREAAEARQASEVEARRAAEARQAAAEAELERLRAELARLRRAG